MNIKETTDILVSSGWSVRKDEVGDRVAQFSLPDRIVDIIYGLDRIRGQQKFGAMLSLTTDIFSNVCSEIGGEKQTYYPLIRAWNGPDIRAPEILEDHIHQALDKAISWAEKQDLSKALREHASLPTDAPGARPIWHLAALALLGDVDRLKSYRASFKAGDRLDFVPYITVDYIDRAISLTQKHMNNS